MRLVGLGELARLAGEVGGGQPAGAGEEGALAAGGAGAGDEARVERTVAADELGLHAGVGQLLLQPARLA